MKEIIRIKQSFQSPTPDQRRKAVTAKVEKLINRTIKKAG